MKRYQYGWILLFMGAAFSIMACGLLSDLADKAQQVENAAGTAKALATAGQEIVTQVSGSGVMQTALAYATQAEESGLMETAQAAIATLPGQSADIKATAEAVITQGTYGQAPANIPIFPGEINAFFGSSSLVTYSAPTNVQSIVDFYRQQMPVYGWAPGGETTVITSSYAVLSYQNASQRVTITISATPLTSESLVVISVFSN